MTPKQRVLKKYPKAVIHSFADQWVVYIPHYSGNLAIASGRTAVQAWASAAGEIRRTSTRK
jgi:hypothetical protein